MRDGGEDDGKRVFSDAKCVWSLGKREMSSSMRDGISICVVVVVVLMVVVGMVVLMAAVGVVVVAIVKRILYIGVVGCVGRF